MSLRRVIRLALLALALTAVMLLTGCKTGPIMNIDHAPVPEARSGQLTLGEVGNAVIKAGQGLGWEMHPKSPGHIVGTYNYRTHQAAVDILYSPSDYTIQYRSSVNLNYDGRTIHKQYNAWVEELATAIDAEIATAQYK